MGWTARLGLALAAALLLQAAPAQAQFLGFCSTNKHCAANRTCQPDLPLTKRCKPRPCNADAECPLDRHACEAGVCTAGCRANSQCPAGEVCSTGDTAVLGKCVRPAPARCGEAACRAGDPAD